MKIVRQITYESEVQHQLDMQLGRSLPDGVRQGIPGVEIRVRTLFDDRVRESVDPPIDPSRPPSIKDELEAMQESGQS